MSFEHDDDDQGGLPFDPIGEYTGASTILDLDVIQANTSVSPLIRELARLAKQGGSLHVLLQSLQMTDVLRLANLFNSFGAGMVTSMQAHKVYGDKFNHSRDLAFATMAEIIMARQLIRMYEGLPIPLSTPDNPDFAINYEVRALSVVLGTYSRINATGSFKCELEFNTEKFTLDESIYDQDISEWLVFHGGPDPETKFPQKLYEYLDKLKDHIRKEWGTVCELRKKVIASQEDLRKQISEEDTLALKGSGLSGRLTKLNQDASVSTGDTAEQQEQPKPVEKVDPISEVLNKMKKM